MISPWGSLLEAGDVPPTMVVGAHRLDDEMQRLHEYSPVLDAGRFAAHERFFVDDIREWASSALADTPNTAVRSAGRSTPNRDRNRARGFAWRCLLARRVPTDGGVGVRAALTFLPMDSRDQPTRQSVASDGAPAALGPYSQAIVAGGFVFCSGTVGIDPQTGQIAEGIEAQTEQALRNIAAILSTAGASMADLVKTTIFYADVDDFAKLNEVYARHMPDPPPARSAPANVKLPRGLLVSIEAIAVLPT